MTTEELKVKILLSNAEIRESLISVLCMVEAIKQVLTAKGICTSEEIASMSQRIKKMPDFKKTLDKIQEAIQYYQTYDKTFGCMDKILNGKGTQEDIETVKMIYKPTNDKIGG